MCDFKEGGWLHTYPHKEHLEDRHQVNHNHLTFVKIQGGFMQEPPFLGKCLSEGNGDNHRKPQLDTFTTWLLQHHSREGGKTKSQNYQEV